MGPPDSDRVSRVPSYSGYRWACSGFRLRGFHPLRRDLPVPSPSRRSAVSRSNNPGARAPRFGLMRVRSPLLAESQLISPPRGTEMFHFPRCRFTGLCVRPVMMHDEMHRVAPFGNPRIKGYVPLPAAYRSLSRPSSPRDAKASVVRPYTLGRWLGGPGPFLARYVAM